MIIDSGRIYLHINQAIQVVTLWSHTSRSLNHLCWGLNFHYFHVGDGHQSNSSGLYTDYKDFLLKVGWPAKGHLPASHHRPTIHQRRRQGIFWKSIQPPSTKATRRPIRDMHMMYENFWQDPWKEGIYTIIYLQICHQIFINWVVGISIYTYQSHGYYVFFVILFGIRCFNSERLKMRRRDVS